MPKMRCPSCGQKYQLPDEAIGKRARCKKCQTVFTVEAPEEEGPIPIADDPFPLAGELDAAVERGAREPAPAHAVATPLPPAMPDMSRLGEAASATGAKSYWKDLVWSFLFPALPGNLATYVLICLALAFHFCIWTLPFIPCFVRLLGTIIILGLYFSFLFNVISQAASGDDDLPSLALSDYWNDAVVPLFRWIGTWAIVLLPALVYVIYLSATGAPGLATLDPSVSGIFGVTKDLIVLLILVLLGLFLWPMLALCVGLGGISTLGRLDLMLVTIAKTFPAYLFTAILVMGSFFLEGFIEEQVDIQIAQASGGIRTTVSAAAITTGVIGVIIASYFEIVAMRCIGLYYRHFKHKFAWDWG